MALHKLIDLNDLTLVMNINRVGKSKWADMDRCCKRKCRRKRKAEAEETWIISIDKNLGNESADKSQHSPIIFISQVASLPENIDFFESHIHWKCFCANDFVDINRNNNYSLLLQDGIV